MLALIKTLNPGEVCAQNAYINHTGEEHTHTHTCSSRGKQCEMSKLWWSARDCDHEGRFPSWAQTRSHHVTTDTHNNGGVSSYHWKFYWAKTFLLSDFCSGIIPENTGFQQPLEMEKALGASPYLVNRKDNVKRLQFSSTLRLQNQT